MFFIRVNDLCFFAFWQHVLFRGFFEFRWVFCDVAISARPSSWSGLSRQDFVWFWWVIFTPFFLSFFNAIAEIFLVLCRDKKWVNVWHWDSATAVCWERCVWLVYCLFVPSNELTPDVTRIVFFYTFIEGLTLIIYCQITRLCSLGLVHVDIALTDLDLITSNAAVISNSEVSFCFCV